MRPLVIVGAGGFARETLDVLTSANLASPTPYTLLGVVDGRASDEDLKLLHERQIPYLGSDDDWFRTGQAAEFVVGIGDPRVRTRIAGAYESQGLRPATLIHASVSIGAHSRIGPGSVICAGAQVSTGVSVGRHVHVNPNATIGHDAELADFTSINPGAVVSGHVRVETGSLVGAGAVILERRVVHRDSLVGAGACVVRDVPAGATVVGVPARLHRRAIG